MQNRRSLECPHKWISRNALPYISHHRGGSFYFRLSASKLTLRFEFGGHFNNSCITGRITQLY